MIRKIYFSRNGSDFSPHSPNVLTGIIWAELLSFPALFCLAIYRTFNFYRGLARSGMTDSIFRSGIEHLSQNIEAGLPKRLQCEASVTNAVLANYLVSELFSLVKWWLDHDMPYTPQRMDQIYHELINPTLRMQLGRLL